MMSNKPSPVQISQHHRKVRVIAKILPAVCETAVSLIQQQVVWMHVGFTVRRGSQVGVQIAISIQVTEGYFLNAWGRLVKGKEGEQINPKGQEQQQKQTGKNEGEMRRWSLIVLAQW